MNILAPSKRTVTEYRTRETLLLKIKEWSDEEAWRQFVQLYTPLVFGYCKKRGLSEYDAADVSQEVMRGISEAIRKFEYDSEKGTFRSWLFTVTRSKLHKFLRKETKQPKGTGRTTVIKMMNEQPDPNEEQDWDLDYKRQMFDWAAGKVRERFSDQAWAAFWSTAVEEKDPESIASQLGITRGAVYAAKARVISALREQVQSVAGEWDLDVI